MSKPLLLPDEVLTFRQSALENDHKLIRLRTGEKTPTSTGWTNGEQPDVLLNVSHDAMNTGLILTGMRAIDIDVDDKACVLEIAGLFTGYLPPGALYRLRRGSPRFALLYRAESGEPRKRSIAGQNGKVEVLGAGQYLHIHGVHPSGAMLSWGGRTRT